MTTLICLTVENQQLKFNDKDRKSFLASNTTTLCDQHIYNDSTKDNVQLPKKLSDKTAQKERPQKTRDFSKNILNIKFAIN